MRSFSGDEIRALDAYAIETLGIPGVILMENAGRGAADAIERMLGTAAGKQVAVVAGSGNNGGDGFVVARQLGLRGAGVVTFLVVPEAKISGDAAVNLRALRALGGEVRELSDEALSRLGESLRQFDVVVDAVGGTGIQGALRGGLATAVEQINVADRPVVAIDVPTGLDCDTGEVDGPAVRARMTVTMLARKQGFDASGSRQFTGEVEVVDIGIPATAVAEMAGID